MSTRVEQVPLAPQPAGGLSDAFRSLFDAEYGYVCRSLRRLGVRDADLTDVAQELFLTVHAQLSSYDPKRPLRPWLFSFAARFAANYRRLAHNARFVEDAGEAEVALVEDPDLASRDLVVRALDRLDFDRRVVIVMHDIEGFSAPEIAEEVNIPLNTVYSRLRLARADFRDALKSLDHAIKEPT